eukprot:3290517-Amphidinium_carterae.1
MLSHKSLSALVPEAASPSKRGESRFVLRFQGCPFHTAVFAGDIMLFKGRVAHCGVNALGASLRNVQEVEIMTC